MFWFLKTVHLYSGGPESKIGLSYVNVVCVNGGWGWGGVRSFKMVCQRGSEFFYWLCVCVWGGGGGVRFSTSPSVKKITDPPPINK